VDDAANLGALANGRPARQARCVGSGDLRERFDAGEDERRRVQERLPALLAHRQAGPVPTAGSPSFIDGGPARGGGGGSGERDVISVTQQPSRKWINEGPNANPQKGSLHPRGASTAV